MMRRSSRAAMSRWRALLLACSALHGDPAVASRRSRRGRDRERPRPSASAPGASTSTRATSRSSRATISQRYASGKWMDADRDPGRQVVRTASARSSTTATRSSSQRSSPARPKDSQLGALYASYMDEARLEQLDAAPLKADLDRGRRDQDQGRVHATSWRDASPISDRPCSAPASVPIPPIRRSTSLFVGTSRHGPAGPRLLPARQVQAAARRLSRLHPAHARADRRRRTRRQRPTQIMAFETEIAKLSWPTGRPARHRQAQQSDDAGAARGLCAGHRLGRLSRRRRRSHVAEA